METFNTSEVNQSCVIPPHCSYTIQSVILKIWYVTIIIILLPNQPIIKNKWTRVKTEPPWQMKSTWHQEIQCITMLKLVVFFFLFFFTGRVFRCDLLAPTNNCNNPWCDMGSCTIERISGNSHVSILSAFHWTWMFLIKHRQSNIFTCLSC